MMSIGDLVLRVLWSGSKQWVSEFLNKQMFETVVFPCCCLQAGLMMLGYSQVSQCLAWYGVWMPHGGNTMKTCSCGQALWVTNCGTFLRPKSSIQTGPIVWVVRSAAHVWQNLQPSVCRWLQVNYIYHLKPLQALNGRLPPSLSAVYLPVLTRWGSLLWCWAYCCLFTFNLLAWSPATVTYNGQNQNCC